MPRKPKSGWPRKLALAPFLLQYAPAAQIAELWQKEGAQPKKSEVPRLVVNAPGSDRAHKSVVLIHFDGGTPCNIPSKGYGIGYGSYQIDGKEVHRVSHGRPMSNNAAEIWTLCSAIEEVLKMPLEHSGVRLRIEGDSQIALKWAASRKADTPKTGSQEFLDSIVQLRRLISNFASVECQWKARHHAVRAFGH